MALIGRRDVMLGVGAVTALLCGGVAGPGSVIATAPAYWGARRTDPVPYILGRSSARSIVVRLSV
ncbi:hypothetical protein AURDEDRAFT_111752 [Auricularia subglabra TFB-10046 SS5]|nr:hypothetical protein AURDEDRAFT_111752 [Auricularia subglabra TFB-10046 SS5]